MSMKILVRAATVTFGIFIATVMTLTLAPAAQAHGYTNAPVSRALYCQQGVVSNCGQIQWEPQSVEGPKGFPAAGPADGKLCAGNLARFSELDDPRGGNWPKTNVQSGQSYQFSWRITVQHATTDFKYYITKPGWNPSQPLTRAGLELTPFLSVPFGGGKPGSQVSHSANLPQRSGHHLIFAVWTISDTGNAFYQCSDVNFG